MCLLMMRKHNFCFYFPSLLQIFICTCLIRVYVCMYVCWCSRLCKPGTLDPRKVRGKILICLRGDKLTSVSEGQRGALAGAVAVFVQNDEQSGNLLLAENHVLPAASISGTHNESQGGAFNISSK